MPWWGKGSSDKDKKDDSSKSSTAPAPPTAPVNPKNDATDYDPNALPARRRLPKGMQSIVDKADREESFYDELVEGYVPDSTESNVRYAAYTNRLRTIMLSAHRYVAYTSDIGESFRPVAHPWLVRSAYGISWAYILGDVSYEGYKAYWQNQRARNPQLVLSEKAQKATGLYETSSALVKPAEVPPLEDWRTVMVQRAVFQSIASMGLPAFTIHSVVKYSGRAMKDVKNKTLRTWTPIGLGLAVVPLLPKMFDQPVETAVEWLFHKAFAMYGGREYVGDAPTTGREAALHQRPSGKEKEL
ncbi:mitochondrial 18 KDa protein-domain-containing protein [Microdochium trichocladiopsis]|uniref:Mitochondrial fission process protein 1 n=1 Tax=Microdochium trichocladiopsis TaxID=1682393 RepID=A0A9P8YCH6_9PEZI|nr:mitochondrial 18 KDa protein-domain-containing protein [Microdochium trichocladiopsis]KAH7035529.1 mitochondrial 18 KDa protein-domain-containing protein [Microdochium trichocladiopsis]